MEVHKATLERLSESQEGSKHHLRLTYLLDLLLVVHGCLLDIHGAG
jgi:hypothetical protein